MNQQKILPGAIREKEWLNAHKQDIIGTKAKLPAKTYHVRPNLYSTPLPDTEPGRGGISWSHLIIGPERSLIIDTGFGAGDLKGLAEELGGKRPIVVFNTHSHHDHTSGNFQFDSVYCPEYDLKNMTETQPGQLHSLTDGQLFNLGDNYLVEAIHIGGHTPGSMVFLDHQNKILFSGDVLMGLTTLIMFETPFYPEYGTISFFHQSLKKLIMRKDEFSCLYPGHGELDLTCDVIPDMLSLTEQVLGHPEIFDTESSFKDIPCKQKSHGTATLRYIDSCL